MTNQDDSGENDDGFEIIPPCAGPLARLSFEDSLDPKKFADATEREVVSYFNTYFADGTSVSLAAIKSWVSSFDMTVAASARATEALRNGSAYVRVHQASGRALPQVADARTGKMVENMKEIGLGRKLLVSAAELSSIAVSAAHIISAADLARTLNRIEKQLDLLIIYRRIDQQAALERIYAFARELLSGPLGDTERLQLWQLRFELRELRATWRREIEYHIEQIENPADDSLFDWVFTKRRTYDKNILGKISEGELRLFLIEYSHRLDQIIAAAGGTWRQSLLSLNDELVSLNRIKISLDKKTQFISKERQKSAEPVSAWITQIIDNYSKIVPHSYVRDR